MNTLPISPKPTSHPVASAIDPAIKSVPPVNPVAVNFVERRSGRVQAAPSERRQFTNSHVKLSPEARALAEAIDRYKADKRRRYITYEEMLEVITQLGYQKQT